MLTLSLACADPEPIQVASESALMSDSSSALGSSGTKVAVTVTASASSEVRLVQFNFESDGTLSEGDTLAKSAVTKGKATLRLPSSPPSGDTARAGSGSPVYYALWMVDSAEGTVTGFSDDMMVWYDSPPSGASTGWNVMSGALGGGSYTYAATSAGVEIEDNIAGSESVVMGGGSSMPPIKGGYRVAMVGASGSGVASLGDVKLTKAWSATVAEDAADEAMADTGGLMVAFYAVSAYSDKDRSETYTESGDTLLGSACSGSHAISARWIDPPATLTEAWIMAQGDMPWGWALGYADDATWTEITPDEGSALTVKASCA
jgi:hypothetical protein